MTDPNAFSESFSKFVPGFEFLQGLVKNAGQTLPSIGQWVAPTLDPAELERRINELRTVQFWLEQNAKMIGTTVQALEVQRMTLGTLKSMNVQMGDLGEALKVRPMSDMFQAAAQAATAAAAAPASSAAPAPAPAPAPAESAAAPAVDPMQWWGALTQQFTELATQAMQATSEATADAQARAAEALKASTEAAAQAQARASEVLAEAVKEVVSNAAETVAVAAPKKTAARKAAPKPASAAPAPASVAAAKPAAAARKAPARKSVKG